MELDGFTDSLTCSADGLALGQPAHVRIAIADVGDDSYDSAVFLSSLTFAPNAAPSAQGVSAATTEGTPVDLTLVGSDPDGDPITFAVGPVSSGTVSGAGPTVTYTPDPNFVGTATFTYTVSDGALTSAPATGIVTVGGSPGPTTTTTSPPPTTPRVGGSGTGPGLGGSMPRTGAAIGGLVVLGLALVLGGAVLRRLRQQSWPWPRVAAIAVAAVVSMAAVGFAVPRAGAAPPGPAPAERLVAAASGGAAHRHLRVLQGQAEAGTGDRDAGTTGHTQAAEYVATRLEAAGFVVTRQEFPIQKWVQDAESLTVAGSAVDITGFPFSPSTPVGGITAPLAVVPSGDPTPACEAADFTSLDVTGKIVASAVGACSAQQKSANAAAAGAVGVVVVDPAVDTSGPPPNIVPTGVTADTSLSSQAGATTTLDLRGHVVDTTTYNVLAETQTGRHDNVVVIGANLDSAPGSPGSNEASGAAALLELALETRGAPQINNAVRFAWWSAGVPDGTGSDFYVQTLSFEEQLNIALYLDVDALASPNRGFFVLDGDDSDAEGAGPGPFGSAQIDSRAGEPIRRSAGDPDPGHRHSVHRRRSRLHRQRHPDRGADFGHDRREDARAGQLCGAGPWASRSTRAGARRATPLTA